MNHPVTESVDDWLRRVTTELVLAWAEKTNKRAHKALNPLVKEHFHMSVGDIRYDKSPEEVQDDFAGHQSVDWAAIKNGNRFVIGLGRTFNGQFIRDDHRPVVAKFDPFNLITTNSQSGNNRELAVWNTATKVGAEEYFTPIYDSGIGVTWILQEQALPIYSNRHSKITGQDYLYSADRGIGSLLENAVNEHGFDGAHDTKHGNIGLLRPESDSLHPVYLDYGSHFTHKEYDIQQRASNVLP